MKALKLLLVSTTLLAFPACSQAGPADNVSVTDKEAIEQIVYDYLMENPEVIREAIIALEAKQDWASINAVEDQIYNDSRDIVLGPDDAKVTIVEFFDYNCTYCKRTTDWIVKTLDEHPDDVRVIFKELPILDGRTQTSRKAAMAAIAAAKQDKYLDMHVALMNARGLSDARIDEIAKENGVDVKKMREDMKDPAIAEYLEETLLIGQQLRPLTGTPFFLIGDEYLSGASIARLDDMLEKALKS